MNGRIRHARGRSSRSDRLANLTPESCLDSTNSFSKISRVSQTAPDFVESRTVDKDSQIRQGLAAFKSALFRIRRSVKYTRLILARSKTGSVGGLGNIGAPSIPVNASGVVR